MDGFLNASGRELFGISFDNATGLITYNLDDGRGQISAGYPFTTTASQLIITADFTLATAFSKISGVNNTSPIFEKFETDRLIISQRLGKDNPNSTGLVTGGYADGYSANSQNVVVPAFLAAFSRCSK